MVWDGQAAVFRKVPPRPTETSYGHLAVKVLGAVEQIQAELKQREIPFRMEPRGPGFLIPVVDDLEGNMIELFPNIETMDLPPEAICAPDRADAAIAHIQREFARKTAGMPAEKGIPLFLPG